MLLEVKAGNRNETRKILDVNQQFIVDDAMFESLWQLFNKLLQIDVIAFEIDNFHFWFETGVRSVKNSNEVKLQLVFGAIESNFNIVIDNIIALVT